MTSSPRGRLPTAMTDDRRQLAEDAARAMGWTAGRGYPEGAAPFSWLNESGERVRDPSLNDPALCWELFIWAVCNEVVMPDWSVTVGSIREALARAVVASKVEPDD